MRKPLNKVFNCKKFAISVLHDEVIILYRGDDTVRLKKFGRKTVRRTKHAGYACVLAVCVALAFSFVPANRDKVAVTERDADEQKEELLRSEKTDYSHPENIKPLTIKTHRVVRGETLSSIAKDYGVSMDTICGSNNLDSYDIISQGTVLRIPNRDGVLHTMQRGQDLLSVAKKYSVSLDKIVAENNLKNADFLSVGRVVFVPDAKPLDVVQGFLWPAATRRITCGYGWRADPFDGMRQFHPGLDICSVYQWVKSAKYGKVTYTGWLGGYGNAVIVAHPGGWKTLYGHLSRIVVQPGQYVKQGQVIAVSGSTGYSTGPHLHFELIQNGAPKNPLLFLK